MQKNKNVLYSLIFLPFFTSIVPTGPLAMLTPATDSPLSSFLVSSEDKAANEARLAEEKMLDEQGSIIDEFLKKYDSPLVGYGRKMAEVALLNDLDYRLIPAIAGRESTFGIHDCIKAKNNPFGWASCKVGFDSMDKAIETIGRNLGGNNPNTSHHYADKSVKQILQAYNPPSIVANYANEVIRIMKKISPEDITS